MRYLVVTASILLTGCGYDYTPTSKQVTVAPDGSAVIFPQECPDWRHSAVVNYDNSAMSNFGCASAANFGKMVAHPGDMLQGRGDHRAETESAVSTVEKFYRGEFVEKAVSSPPATTQ